MLTIIKYSWQFANISIIILAIAVTLATFLGFASHLWWGFELLEHPRLQYCQVLLIAIVMGLITRQNWSLGWLFPLTINLVIVLPLFFPSHLNLPPEFNVPTHTLRILHANLDRHNPQMDRAIEYIDSQHVDLLLLQEITPSWLTRLQNNLQNYQLIAAEPRDNSLGSAILTPVFPTQPLVIKEIKTINLPADSDRPLIKISLAVATEEVVIVSYHVIRPRSPETSAYQQTEFDAIANWSRTQHQAGKKVIVIGDFNSTPWSSRFRKLLADSNLNNSQSGYGWQTTWLANLPAPLRIPIDHCLQSQAFTVISRYTGMNIDSDHLPLFVELGLHILPPSPDGNIAVKQF